MKNYVYVLYNNLSNRYESVMSYASDGMALARLQEAKINTTEWTLCRVGSIDIENGTVEPCAPVRLIWNVVEKLPVTESNDKENK